MARHELRAAGCEARVEEERAHGGYWWPLGLLNAASALAAPRRLLAALVGAVAAAAVWDDVSGGRLWFRRLLPHRSTWNVVAEAGDRDAARTIVFIAHHDAAHSGLVFHPSSPARDGRLPNLHAKANQSLPIIYRVFLGPLLVALGGLAGQSAPRRVGAGLAVGAAAAMADIGARAVVPGANDNLSSVATVVALAHSRERPVRGLRVMLVSTGSEESFMEGMQAFRRRHFPRLPRSQTEFVCLECVGSPQLCVVEGRACCGCASPRGRSRGAGAGGRGRRCRAAARPAHRSRHGRADPAALRLPRMHARGRRRDQVPGQLPLAHRHARQPRLVLGRGAVAVCEALVRRAAA